MNFLVKNLLSATAAISVLASAVLADDVPKRGGHLLQFLVLHQEI